MRCNYSGLRTTVCDCIVHSIQNRHRPSGPRPQPRPKPPAKRRSQKGIRRPGSGRKSGVPLPMQRAITAAIADGLPVADIARRSGASYEQVRTLRRKVTA